MIGIDEVGRGCWAGPLVVAAVRFKNYEPEGLKDSKKLSRLQREKLFPIIEANSDIGLAVIEPESIDSNGLSASLRQAFIKAYNNIAKKDDLIIVDGNINYLSELGANAICKIKADATYSVVSAASIYAKVYRDNYMKKLSKIYPNYGFESNVGYGTKKHINALERYGPINGVHRFSYEPVKKLLT